MEGSTLTKYTTSAILSDIPLLKPRKLPNLDKLNKFHDKLVNAPLEALAIHKESLEKIKSMETELKEANKKLHESNEIALRAEERALEAKRVSFIAKIWSFVATAISIAASAIAVYDFIRINQSMPN